MSVIFKEIKEFKKQLIFLILSVIGSTLCIMLLPTRLQKLIDYSIPGKDVGSVWLTTGTMLILVTGLILCGIVTAKLSSLIAMGVGRNMRAKMFNKVQGLSREEIDKFTASSLITRTNGDINQVQTFLSLCLNLALVAPIMAIVGVALSVHTSPSLSAVLLVSVPILAVIVIAIGKIAIPLSARIQRKLDNINLIIREKLTGTRVIRAFGTTAFEEKRFDTVNVDYTRMNKKLQNITALFLPAIYVVVAATIGAIMFVAFKETQNTAEVHTTGEIMAVIQYIMFILIAVVCLTIVFLMLPRAATSANRAKEVLESENLIKDASEARNNEDSKGYLEFKNVTFRYAGADVPAIKNISFKAAPGETTAIIGGTGTGKSTIINLIPRLYDVTEGQVLVDGIDVRDYKLDVLRSKIGFVPQKAILFKGTIDSNIAFGGNDMPTEDQIEEAVITAQSYDFVTEKKDGFNTAVSQGGSNFSGGQKQRLCIARAIVREPEIYVFDDSFSALDFKTDKTLRKALKEKTKDATTVIVAQRINTIMEADRILVIEQGEVVGMGTHKELLDTCRIYREIAKSQLSEEELNR